MTSPQTKQAPGGFSPNRRSWRITEKSYSQKQALP